MAKATAGSVTLELTATEAKALHALTGGTSGNGKLHVEINDVFDALVGAGVSSDDIELAWDEDGCVYLVEA